MNLKWLYDIWQDHVDWAWWQMLLIGVFFLFCNFCLCIAFVYMRREIVITYGYPKRKKKYMKKKWASFSIVDKFLLIKLTMQAEKQGKILYLNLICHFMNVLSFLICCVGFIGGFFTLCDGWCIVLLMVPMPITFVLTCALEVVPHLIAFPSERRRWKR